MAKNINRGDLNRRITIQTETAARGTSGQEILTWATLFSCWAKVDFGIAGAGEKLEPDQVIVTTVVDFTIRKRTVDEKMRIVYGSSNFSIININEAGGRNEFLVLKAQKVE